MDGNNFILFRIDFSSDVAQTALQAFSDFEKGRPLATGVVASGPT